MARRLRLDPAMGGMTLVAMTGYGQEEERRRTREAGFHSHLVKPVTSTCSRNCCRHCRRINRVTAGSWQRLLIE